MAPLPVTVSVDPKKPVNDEPLYLTVTTAVDAGVAAGQVAAV
jgi:hypothetical protein